jgi:hypothetical protein
MRPAVALGAVLCAAAIGCTSGGGASDKELEGLVVAPPAAPTTVDVGRALRDPQALVAAMRLPWSRAAGQLGDHRLTVRTTMELREAAAVLEALTDTTVIERVSDGRYHAVYENSADYGREVVFDAGKLYLRPRYAKWHERAPESAGEPASITDEMGGALAAHLELYAHGIELSDKGTVQEAGRPGRKVEIKLDPSPAKAPKPELTQHAWRDGAVVEAAAGELVLDEATGLALRARLDVTVAFTRDGKRLTMHLVLDQNVTREPVTVAVPAADQIVATPTRSTEVDDRNFLLQGIAPAVGKGKVSKP